MGRCLFKKYSFIFFLFIVVLIRMKVSRWRHLLLPVGSLVVGGLILALLPHFPSAAPYLSPIFFLFPLPIIHLIISGLHQLIKYALSFILLLLFGIYSLQETPLHPCLPAHNKRGNNCLLSCFASPLLFSSSIPVALSFHGRCGPCPCHVQSS